MPISLDEFEKLPKEKPARAKVSTEELLEFLSEQAYSTKRDEQLSISHPLLTMLSHEFLLVSGQRGCCLLERPDRYSLQQAEETSPGWTGRSRLPRRNCILAG